MDYLKGLWARIFKSFADEKNQGYATVCTAGGLFCGWHITTLSVLNILGWLKPVLGLASVILAPAIGVFMKDVYENKVKPSIFKKK